VAPVLVAVERQHAWADDLRCRKPGIVDGETDRIAHDLDA